jgi:uncharacterized membrane protein SpoIIM required for sporulation
MDLQAFIRLHKHAWIELEQLTERFEKKSRRISGDDIDRLTHLYKSASSDYAMLNTHYPEDDVTSYVHRIVSKAHNVMYKEQHKSAYQLHHFFLHHFPALIEKRRWFILFAFLLFAIGGVSGFISVASDPLNAHFILPPEYTEVEPHSIGEGHETLNNALFSAGIMTNNIQVALIAFLGGITFGLWTGYILLFNGLVVGALAALYWLEGMSYPFWAYILPHGVLELAVIFIAGGAGLYMGYKIMVPGPYPRKFQLARSAKESVQLLLGTVPLFVIAGIIEGYITPSALSLEMKYAFSILSLLLIGLYYAYARVPRKVFGLNSRA